MVTVHDRLRRGQRRAGAEGDQERARRRARVRMPPACPAGGGGKGRNGQPCQGAARREIRASIMFSPGGPRRRSRAAPGAAPARRSPCGRRASGCRRWPPAPPPTAWPSTAAPGRRRSRRRTGGGAPAPPAGVGRGHALDAGGGAAGVVGDGPLAQVELGDARRRRCCPAGSCSTRSRSLLPRQARTAAWATSSRPHRRGARTGPPPRAGG